jgi:hypothetical integral membrane protein (TIGR02206 family)
MFVLLGRDHVGALLCIAGLAAGLARLVRRAPEGRLALGTRIVLPLFLAGTVSFELTVGALEGWLTLEMVVPLQLCDAAIVLAIAGLVTLSRGVAEVLYFWTLSGSALALLTPDVRVGFPRFEFLVFFGLHGLVVVAAVVLVFGFGLRPRSGAPWRVFLLTNAWAAIAALVNFAWGTNYLYLCAKPQVPTLLDHFGPWPVYILACNGLALLLFHGLDLPFRRGRARMHEPGRSRMAGRGPASPRDPEDAPLEPPGGLARHPDERSEEYL